MIGYVRIFQRRHEEAVAAGETAVELSPSWTDAYHMAGMYHGYAGDFHKSVLYEQQAQRLSPLERNESMVDEARARFHLSDFESAKTIASRVLASRPGWLTAQTTLLASLWNLNEEDEARVVAKDILAGHPRFSISRWARGLPYKYEDHLQAVILP